MVYVFGIIGFIGGFSMGVFLIGMFLRDKSGKELMQNKTYRWTYGVLVWLVAAFGAWAGVFVYRQYFF